MAEVIGGAYETLTQNNSPKNKLGDDFSVQDFGEKRRLQMQRIQLLEERNTELEAIQDLLSSDNDKQNFTLIGREAKILLHKNDTFSRVPGFGTISRERLEQRTLILQEALREDRQDRAIKRLDNLIDSSPLDSPNVAMILKQVRLDISGYGNNDYYDYYGEELQDLLFALEKFESKSVGLDDILQFSFNTIQFTRKTIPHNTKLALAGVKDLTSARLFTYGEKKGNGEIWLEESIIGNEYIPNFAEKSTFEVANFGNGLLAGGIDGSLDFLGAFVDINLVPDEVIAGLFEVLPTLFTKFGEVAGNIYDGIDNPSDVAYLMGYMAVMIGASFYLNLPVVWGPLVANIASKMKSLGISQKIISKMSLELTKSEEVFTKFFKKSVPVMRAMDETVPKVLKGSKEVIDNGATATKKFVVSDSKLLGASEKALNKLAKAGVLADIFGDKIRGQLDNQSNTQVALKVYEEIILREEVDFKRINLDEMIWTSKADLRYNLVRIKERFTEVERIFDEEIMPNISKLTDINKASYLEKKKLQRKLRETKEYDELTRLILEQYIVKY